MNGVIKAIAAIPARVAISILTGYHRWISPMMAPSCRFHPTCSVYAIEVIASFGFLKGGFLTIKRLLKCHPFHPGGVDLPPKPSPDNRCSF